MCVVCAAKSKGQRIKAFLRVMKYSTGGVLEVNIEFLIFFHIQKIFKMFSKFIRLIVNGDSVIGTQTPPKPSIGVIVATMTCWLA